MKNNLFIIVLAAGKGTRINAVDMPKNMFKINGKPMIGYFQETIAALKPAKAIFVVGFHGQQIIDYMQQLGDYDYVWQKEQLGTGHAAAQAESILKGKDGTTIIVNGDNPLFRPETMLKMVSELTAQKAVLAISSARLDLEQFPYGRIITDSTGHVTKVVEVKNCTPEELKIKDLNCGLYVVDNAWLWDNVGKIQRNGVSQEFYITDLVEIANQEGKRVITVPILDKREAIGINTKENLKEAEAALEK